MFNQSRNFRSSIRSGNSSRRYSSNRPVRTGQSFAADRTGQFNKFRGFNRPQKPRNQSKLTGEIDLFIKKSVATVGSENFIAQKNFTDFEISDALKENILRHGYLTPTPIQDQAIDPILQGRDLIGLANTGTGKTAAFLIPLIDKIFKNRDHKALIIAPTRELALQIQEELRSFSAGMHLYSALVIGGSNMRRQIYDVQRNPHFVIATPGRLKDLIQRDLLYLEDFDLFVLDEVDLMVDIGFIQDVKYFVSLLPKVRQSLFFSATISPKVKEVLQNFVNDPVTVSVKMQDTAENVDQDVIRVADKNKKIDQLHDLLIQDGFDKVLVFGRTKHGIEKLNRELEFRGFKVGSIHGNKTQGHRQRTLDSFKRNQIQILLATDVASRGLDIENVTHVINYDLPETYDDYIHRIGRTGRAGKTGTALTFVE